MEQAAGLLAMHCMVRGQTPLDYLVMVQAPDQILKSLTERTGKLLQSWRAVSPVQLTRREQDVLDGIVRSLANKEIALNVSERTVKFHVSSLLSKFHVPGRTELAREAARLTTVPIATPQPAVSPSPPRTLTFDTRQRQGGQS